MMTVGIKYCGGCNPRYDRVREVTALKAAHPEFDFVSATSGHCFDYVIVVCGCPAACASHQEITARFEKFILHRTEDYYVINSVLSALKAREEGEHES